MSFDRILVAIDGSTLSFEAAKVGIDLAVALGAQIATLFVVEPPVSYSGEIGIPPEELLQVTDRNDEAALAGLRHAMHVPEGTSHQVRVGHPADAIEEVAREWRADLIVVGSHGRSGLGRVLLGSVADAVVRRAPCPVLLVRNAPYPTV